MQDNPDFSRRRFLQRSGMGFRSLALGHLLGREGHAAETGLHFPAKAKHVIHVFLNGRDIRYLDGMDMVIPQEAQVRIFPAVGGGV